MTTATELGDCPPRPANPAASKETPVPWSTSTLFEFGRRMRDWPKAGDADADAKLRWYGATLKEDVGEFARGHRFDWVTYDPHAARFSMFWIRDGRAVETVLQMTVTPGSVATDLALR